MIAKLQETGVEAAILAAQHGIDARLQIVVDTAPGYPTEEGEGAIVRVEYLPRADRPGSRSSASSICSKRAAYGPSCGCGWTVRS